MIDVSQNYIIISTKCNIVTKYVSYDISIQN